MIICISEYYNHDDNEADHKATILPRAIANADKHHKMFIEGNHKKEKDT
jgi:hypothetical protein